MQGHSGPHTLAGTLQCHLKFTADEGAMRAGRQDASELSECKVVSSAVLVPLLAGFPADSLLGADAYFWIAWPATQHTALNSDSQN